MARAGAHAHRRATHIHSRGKNGTSCRCCGGATSSKMSRMRCCGEKRVSNSSPVPPSRYTRAFVPGCCRSKLAVRKGGDQGEGAARRQRMRIHSRETSSPPRTDACTLYLHALAAPSNSTRIALFNSDSSPSVPRVALLYSSSLPF